MSSTTNQRRQMLQRRPDPSPTKLNRRAVALLSAVEAYGGVLSTEQIALLFWPPSLEHKLWAQGIDKSVSKQLRLNFSDSHLNERIELFKWLHQLAQAEPEQLLRLDLTLQLVMQGERSRSLRQLIARPVTLPDPFLRRRRLRSEVVSSSCKGWLRRLFDAGYLEPQEQPTQLSEGRKPLLWYLSKQGRKFLADFRQVSLKEIDWKPAGSFSPAMLPHRLQNTDLRISVELAARHHGWTIHEWRDDAQLRQLHSKPAERVSWRRPERPNDPDSQLIEESGGMVPDGYFWLDTGKNWHSFLECDRATETIQYRQGNLRDFAHKIRAYGAYYKSGRYAIRYPQAGKSFRVLVVTTSQPRLLNLKACIENVVREGGGREREAERGLMRYWLTTFDQIQPTWRDYFSETVLTGDIWTRAGQEEPRALIW